MTSNFELMATYNQWMNQKLYDAASKLDAVQLDQDRGAFFGSIFGTLNHVLVGDTIWLKRFSRHPNGFVSLEVLNETPMPKGLDSRLHASFDELAAARQAMDDIILAFSKDLTDEAILDALEYTNTKGERFVRNFGSLLQHFFNHQTHHRGQVTTLLNQCGVDVGVTDLLMCIPEE